MDPEECVGYERRNIVLYNPKSIRIKFVANIETVVANMGEIRLEINKALLANGFSQLEHGCVGL